MDAVIINPKYNDGLKIKIEEIFREYVKPLDFLLYVNSISEDVITKHDKVILFVNIP